jgi:hypothetical protein
VAVVGKPAPIMMQDTATRTSVINSVAECTVSRPVGSRALIKAPKSDAKALTIAAMLKGVPVTISTPMMIPTVAAAAPTESAYLLPIWEASMNPWRLIVSQVVYSVARPALMLKNRLAAHPIKALPNPMERAALIAQKAAQ